MTGNPQHCGTASFDATCGDSDVARSSACSTVLFVRSGALKVPLIHCPISGTVELPITVEKGHVSWLLSLAQENWIANRDVLDALDPSSPSIGPY